MRIFIRMVYVFFSYQDEYFDEERERKKKEEKKRKILAFERKP